MRIISTNNKFSTAKLKKQQNENKGNDGRTMAQAVSRRHLNAEGQVRARVRSVRGRSSDT
jgi:hypothetical protein